MWGFTLGSEGAVLFVRKDNLGHVKVIVHLFQRALHTVEAFARKRLLRLLAPLFQPQLPFENKERKKNQEEYLDSQQDGQVSIESVHQAHQ